MWMLALLALHAWLHVDVSIHMRPLVARLRPMSLLGPNTYIYIYIYMYTYI